MAHDEIVVRRDVWSLSRENVWHPTLAWYAEAVLQLQHVDDIADPRDWRHLAAIHWTVLPPSGWPESVDDQAWNACQHGSWHFLPWHRMYLHHFEAIVRETVRSLGGPPDWALPFWNYDPADSPTLSLPPAFLAQKMEDGERDNPLFVADRDPETNRGEPLDPGNVDVQTWSRAFAGVAHATPEFGGVRLDWSHSARSAGEIERAPHGVIHSDVGGFMAMFHTAPLDPIFWLHHCNVDRLWEAWRNLEGRRNPTDERWLARVFQLGGGPRPTSLVVRDVVATTAHPMRYRYEGVSVPREATAPARRRPSLTEEEMVEEIPPKLVGASERSVPLAGAENTVEVAVERRGA